RLTTFTSHPDDPHSLTDNWVDALYEDERGRLWAGSRSGLQVYEPATHGFTRYPLPAGQSRGAASADVRAITGDGQGGLWLATGDGLQHFDPASG
ncbi:two-component regulator propeller domain-containing protein, partial [Acinetobacter baumannii]